MGTTADDRAAASRRRARRRIRYVAVALLAGAGLAAACSPDDGGIAEVTLPELDTTTTTTAPEGPGSPGGAGDSELAPPPPVWTVQVGGAGDDVLRSLASTDDEIVVVGSTTGPVPRTPDEDGGPPVPTAGGTDVLLATVDTEGVVLTARAAGSAGDDVANGVAPIGAGTMACGSTAGQLGAGHGGALDLWCGLLGDPETLGGVTQLGGPDTEEVTGLAGDPDQEHLYASGRVGGLLPGAQDPTGRGLGAGDAIALQLTPDGTPVWARQFGTPAEDGAHASAVTPDGDGLFVGYTDGDLGRTSSGGRDAWISRFDPAGRQRWITQFGSSGSDTLVAVATAGDASRGTEMFVGAGSTDGDLGADSSGASREGAVEPDAGGGITAAGPPDGVAAAFATDGTLTWVTTLASDARDEATATVADGGIVYVAGTTEGDLGELLPEAGPGGGSDGFLAALDAASGRILWVARFGSTGDEAVTSMATTEDGLVVLAGTTTGQMSDTPPGEGLDGFLIAFPLSAAGGGAASSV